MFPLQFCLRQRLSLSSVCPSGGSDFFGIYSQVSSGTSKALSSLAHPLALLCLRQCLSLPSICLPGWRSQDEPDPARGGPLLRSVPVFGGLGQHDSEGTHGSVGAVTGAHTGGGAERGGGGGLPAGKMEFHDGNAWYMYWDFPLNGPPAAEVETWPLGGTAAEQQATLTATGARWPTMGNYSLTYGNR
eukprot:SAG22_NODE_1967_length_3237_cov_1.563416_5_plen_188_part_00